MLRPGGRKDGRTENVKTVHSRKSKNKRDYIFRGRVVIKILTEPLFIYQTTFLTPTVNILP